jgi:hypothetical protein
VPDFLLASADRTVRVVNVKPADRLADPAVAEAPAWPGELFVARGWGYEVWSGADPALLANIRFLAGYRGQGMPPDAVTAAVLGEVRPSERVRGLLDRLERSWRRVGARYLRRRPSLIVIPPASVIERMTSGPVLTGLICQLSPGGQVRAWAASPAARPVMPVLAR